MAGHGILIHWPLIDFECLQNSIEFYRYGYRHLHLAKIRRSASYFFEAPVFTATRARVLGTPGWSKCAIPM